MKKLEADKQLTFTGHKSLPILPIHIHYMPHRKSLTKLIH